MGYESELSILQQCFSIRTNPTCTDTQVPDMAVVATLAEELCELKSIHVEVTKIEKHLSSAYRIVWGTAFPITHVMSQKSNSNTKNPKEQWKEWEVNFLNSKMTT